MTIPSLFRLDLDAMLAGVLGADVVSGATRTRGVLTREWREQEDGSGMTQQVWTTVLTVRDGTLPTDCRESSVLTIDAVAYVVRRKARADDYGAREYFVVERTS